MEDSSSKTTPILYADSISTLKQEVFTDGLSKPINESNLLLNLVNSVNYLVSKLDRVKYLVNHL